MLRFRDPLWTLAERDLRVRYKQTALGVTRSWFACRAAWSQRLVGLVRRREAWSVKD